MAHFNLQDYETVEDRLKRLYSLYPDARVITTNLTTPQDRQVSTWVVKAEIYLPIWNLGAALEDAKIDYSKGYERDCWFLKATGHAFEIDGVNGMANKTSALENCETSAIGRALANMNLSGNKRTSREEMQKVQRMSDGEYYSDALEAYEGKDLARLRNIYSEAQKTGASKELLKEIADLANGLKQSQDSQK